MVRYRWCQFVSACFQIPYTLLAILWFKLVQPVNERIKHVFMIAPAKIIRYDKDLMNLGDSLSQPLELQLITRTEALSILNLISLLNETDLQVETRYELSERVARDWSYAKLKRIGISNN